MSKVNFMELADFCIDRYKTSLEDKRERYVDTLFVAIFKDNEVLCSKTSHLLGDASKCILIHHKKKIAVTNWYDWYKVEYINEEGCVFDGNMTDGFSFEITWQDSYAEQRMRLCYNNRIMYSCRKPWEDSMAKIWELYIKLKNIESDKEKKLVADLFKKDEKIFELEKQNADFKFSNYMLEQERDQYKGLLEEIRDMIK